MSCRGIPECYPRPDHALPRIRDRPACDPVAVRKLAQQHRDGELAAADYTQARRMALGLPQVGPTGSLKPRALYGPAVWPEGVTKEDTGSILLTGAELSAFDWR